MSSVTVRFTKTGTHIRARGKSAQALFDAMTKGLEDAAPAGEAEGEGLVECDNCPNVTAGCLGKCMKAEVA